MTEVEPAHRENGVGMTGGDSDLQEFHNSKYNTNFFL